MRIVMADWHKLLGISALAFNLMIALTGAWLGLQPWLMRWMDITTPNAYRAPVVMEPEADKALAVLFLLNICLAHLIHAFEAGTAYSMLNKLALAAAFGLLGSSLLLKKEIHLAGSILFYTLVVLWG